MLQDGGKPKRPKGVSYGYLCEDGQQQREDSQVGSDPLSSETTAQVLWHRHDLNKHMV